MFNLKYEARVRFARSEIASAGKSLGLAIRQVRHWPEMCSRLIGALPDII